MSVLEAVDTRYTRPEVRSNTCPGPDHWPYWGVVGRA